MVEIVNFHGGKKFGRNDRTTVGWSFDQLTVGFDVLHSLTMTALHSPRYSSIELKLLN